MKYKLTGDYHTHTVFSHGKGTIRENVLHARQLGLKAIAITDHGPGHNEHGMKRESVPEMRRIITACVAAATVLLMCLSLFIGYQWITLGVLNQREKALKEDIKKYEAIIEKDNKEYFKNEE